MYLLLLVIIVIPAGRLVRRAACNSHLHVCCRGPILECWCPSAWHGSLYVAIYTIFHCMRFVRECAPHPQVIFLLHFLAVIGLGVQFPVHSHMQLYSLPFKTLLLLHAVLNALFNCLREAHSRQDVKAIVVTGAKGKFSAGFDINQFAKSGGGGIDSRCDQQPLMLDAPYSSVLSQHRLRI